MTKEIWRPIKGYEGYYEVSSHGRVRSLDRYVNSWQGLKLRKGRILKHDASCCGYIMVLLCKDDRHSHKLVHRLMAQAFIPNPENKPQVNHIDEVKSNNYVSNLEWVTPGENINHGTRNERCALANSKKVGQYTLDGELIKLWFSASEAGRDKYCQSNVSKCCRGEVKTHKGYIWKYIDKEVEV